MEADGSMAKVDHFELGAELSLDGFVDVLVRGAVGADVDRIDLLFLHREEFAYGAPLLLLAAGRGAVQIDQAQHLRLGVLIQRGHQTA